MTQLVSPGNEPEKEPLQAAYQRLKEARDAVDAASVHTMPLSKLTTMTEELKNAKEDFETALEREFITVNGHILCRHEYEALEQLARPPLLRQRVTCSARNPEKFSGNLFV